MCRMMWSQWSLNSVTVNQISHNFTANWNLHFLTRLKDKGRKRQRERGEAGEEDSLGLRTRQWFITGLGLVSSFQSNWPISGKLDLTRLPVKSDAQLSAGERGNHSRSLHLFIQEMMRKGKKQSFKVFHSCLLLAWFSRLNVDCTLIGVHENISDVYSACYTTTSTTANRNNT